MCVYPLEVSGKKQTCALIPLATQCRQSATSYDVSLFHLLLFGKKNPPVHKKETTPV